MTDPFAPPTGDQPQPPSQPVYASPPPYGAPSQPPPPYGAPLYGTPLAPQGRNGLGTASLVLGILALLSCWTVAGGIVLGVVALVLGLVGRGRAKRKEASNGGVALWGAALGGLGLLAGAGFLALYVSLYNSPEGQRLIDCLDAANGDSAATQQCEDTFVKDVFN